MDNAKIKDPNADSRLGNSKYHPIKPIRVAAKLTYKPAVMFPSIKIIPPPEIIGANKRNI